MPYRSLMDHQPAADPDNDGNDEGQLLRHEVELAADGDARAQAQVLLADFLVRERRELEEAAALYDAAIDTAQEGVALSIGYHAHVGRARVARLQTEVGIQAHHLEMAIVVCEQLGADRAVPDLLLLRSSLDVDGGDLDAARARLVYALEVSERHHDEHQQARVHFELGRLERRCGATQLARAHFELARPSLLERGPARLAASVELELGLLAFAVHDHEVAEERLRNARALWLELGSPALAARTLSRLGELARVTGHRDEAAALLDQALDEAVACGDSTLQAHTHCSRGDLARLTSHYRDAERSFTAALDIAVQDANVEVQVRAGIGLASVKRVGGHTAAARELLEQAATLATVHGDPRGGVNARISLAGLARMRDDLDSCERLLHSAQALATEADYDLGLSNVAHGASVLAIQRGDLREAENQLQLAEVFSRELGARHGGAHVLVTRAQVASLLGDTHQALHWLDLAAELADQVGYRMLLGHIARMRAVVMLDGAVDRETVPGETAPVAPADLIAVRGHIRRALDVATSVGDVVGLADAVAVQGDVALRSGAVDVALDGLTQAEATHRRVDARAELTTDVALLVEAHRMAGDNRRAQRREKEAIRLVLGLGAGPAVISVATRLLAAAGRSMPEADRRVVGRTALAAFRQMAERLPDMADCERFHHRWSATIAVLGEGDGRGPR